MKLSVYAENGVPGYWVVNLVDRRIEVHTEPSREGYTRTQSFAPGESISPVRFPDLVIAVSDVIR